MNQRENKQPQSAKVENKEPEGTQTNNFVTANGQVSVEQLKELMKNPQIARFLKEQIDLQQKQADANGNNNQNDDGNKPAEDQER